MSAWFRIEDAMPPLDPEWTEAQGEVVRTVGVLFCGHDGKRVVSGYAFRWTERDGAVHPWGWRLFGADDWDLDGVTHWMPLPEAP